MLPGTQYHLLCAAILSLTANATAQEFGDLQVITDDANGARSAYTVDLDGDGDLDALSASLYDHKIAWYENLGDSSFGPQQVIATYVLSARFVNAADLDGDGDADVLSASAGEDKIAWYENLGGGAFGHQRVITTDADYALSVHVTDVDSDGDVDVISASYNDDRIAWYENFGGGVFGPPQIITDQAHGPWSTDVADLDNDGDGDVLCAASKNHKVSWYENLGDGTFGDCRIIGYAYSTPPIHSPVHAADMDGDGDLDVLSASDHYYSIFWFENLTGGVFGPSQSIAGSADDVYSIRVADLDTDGDPDLLAGSKQTLAWYENLGACSFGPQKLVTTQSVYPKSLCASDLDADGDLDVLSAGGLYDGGDVIWFQNLMQPAWTQSPLNRHWYRLTQPTRWHDAEYAMAQRWGGHLCTIRDQTENDWLRSTFALSRPVWIGYTDQSQEGVFEWSSSETPPRSCIDPRPYLRESADAASHRP